MSNDYFQFRQFTVRQERCAMKVGTDGTLLGAWASLGGGTMMEGVANKTPRILDVGTGTGLIALMMAQRFPSATVVGIDIDEAAVLQARENVGSSPFAERISIRQEDVAQTDFCGRGRPRSPFCEEGYPRSSGANLSGNSSSPQTSGLYDAVVSNPPYFVASLKCADTQRSQARHADTLPYRTLMERAWQLLTDEGQVSVIVPTQQQRLMESEAMLAGFFKVRECMVKTSATKPAKRCMLAFAKHPTPLERTELILGSDAYHELTKDFYL